MRQVELNTMELFELRRYSILMKEQKEQSQHACIILEEKDTHDVKKTAPGLHQDSVRRQRSGISVIAGARKIRYEELRIFKNI